MCRVDERVYVRTDGHRSVFQETTHCEKGRRRWKVCSDARVRRTEYPDPTGEPASSLQSSPIVPVRVPRLSTSDRPSARDGSRSLVPEIHISIGKKGKGRHEASVLIVTGKQKQLTSAEPEATGNDASESEASHIPQSVYSNEPSSDKSIAWSKRVPSMHQASIYHDTPNKATSTASAPNQSRPVIHSDFRRAQSSAALGDAQSLIAPPSKPSR